MDEKYLEYIENNHAIQNIKLIYIIKMHKYWNYIIQ